MAGDALYPDVSLLLHCNGTNGSTTFTDSSPTPKTITAQNGAAISTARSQFGGASALFDGTNDYLIAGNAPDWKHLHDDSTDFAIEGWIYWSGGSSDMTILSTAVGSADIGILLQVLGSRSRKLRVQIYRGASGSNLSAPSPSGITSGAWPYFKFSYTKTTRAYAFRIGSSHAGSGTMTVTGTWPASSTSNPSFTLAIGRYQNAAPGGYLAANLDELRITPAPRTETTEPASEFLDYAGQVSGNVKDSASANAARTVRAYRRDTGALVGSATSDGTSGNYTINCATLDEVTVIALDNATSGTYYNDQAARVIPA